MASPFKHPKSGVYYLRRAVPQDIRQALGKSEVLKSLGTKDPKEAKPLFAAAFAESEAMFARARAGKGVVDALDDDQIKDIAAAWAAHVLGEDDELRLEGLDDRSYRKMQETYDIVLPALKAELARGTVDPGTAYEFDDFLRSHGYNVPVSSFDYRRVHLAMLRAWVRALEIEQRRHQGEPIDTPKAPEIGPRRLLTDGQSDPAKLSGAFQGWRLERKPTDKVWSEWSLALRRFVETNGDVAVAKLDRAHIRKFKDSLIDLGLSQSSIKKQLTAIRTVLAWGVDNGLCDQNVAAGIKVRDAKVQRESRLPYDGDDLKRLFSSSIYTDGRRPAAGGGEAAYWVPLVALYMGCRLEEIGQALMSDVVTLGDIVCLDINDRSDGKSVKAASSRRTIPVHPELLRLGFRDYLGTLDSSGRLFPDLRQDQFGKWTGNFSKWWGRWARDLGVTDRRKVFHSFRHCFKAACRQAGIAEEQHDLLTGHRGTGVGRSYGRTDAYGAELVQALAQAVAKVQYKADLSAVQVWQRPATRGPNGASDGAGA
jgi:integrase